MELDSLRPFLLMSAVAAVAVVGWIAIYRAKVSPAGGSRSIEVLETTMLAQGATLHLVRVGSRRFALARTSQNVEVLCEIDAADAVATRGAEAASVPVERFRRLFRR